MDSTLIAIGITFVLGISISATWNSFKQKKKQKTGSKSDFLTLNYPRKFIGNLQELTNPNSNSKLVQQSLHDPASYSLSLVIPAYNEARRLKRMLNDALPVLQSKAKPGKSFSAEIILVDDGSKDTTCEEYMEYVKSQLQSSSQNLSFKLLKLPQNCGKGRAGFLASAGEFILFADADGSTDFSAANKFHSLMMSSPKNQPILICGSRAAAENSEEKNQVKRSLFRWILMKAFHAFISIFGVRSVKDTQCGFKMMNRKAARMVVPWIHISGWIFDVEMILIAEAKGVSVLEVPVPWKEMDGTKLSLAIDSLKMARDLLRIRFNYFSGLWKYK